MQASIGARGRGGEATLAFPISGFTLKRLGRIRVRRLPMLGQRFLRTSSPERTHVERRKGKGTEGGKPVEDAFDSASIRFLCELSIFQNINKQHSNQASIHRNQASKTTSEVMVERALSQAGPSFSSTRHEDQRDETTSTTTTRGA